jgi:hypothetical protein
MGERKQVSYAKDEEEKRGRGYCRVGERGRKREKKRRVC